MLSATGEKYPLNAWESKLAGEQWCAYYHSKYNVDVRSLRYPGLIGHESIPGGGTTDYAVTIFHEAMAGNHFTCYLSNDQSIPMMYMEDAIRATLEIMEADEDKIKIRDSYNLAGISFSPEQIAKEIQRHYPEFTISYEPDSRNSIADTWPNSIDDKMAKDHWQWNCEFDLKKMTDDMFLNLKKKAVIKP